MRSLFSPHIFVYKPQTNSVFSLFLRFILILVFIDFVSYTLSLFFLNSITFSFILDLVYVSEVVLTFYVLANLCEEFIDYESIELNYWDIDLVTFFNFFFIFFIILIITSLFYLIFQFSFWPTLIVS